MGLFLLQFMLSLRFSSMAYKSKCSLVGLGFFLCCFVILVLLLCSVIMQQHYDCVTGHGCYYGEMVKQNRKLLSGGSELRVAPSGPDPLHHNGNPKNKKPRSP